MTVFLNVPLWLQIRMMAATGLQRGLELISDLQLHIEVMMILMQCKAHQEGHSRDTPGRMCQ